MEKEEWNSINNLIHNQISSYADEFIQIQIKFKDVFLKQQLILEPVIKEYINAVNRIQNINKSFLNPVTEIASQFREAFDFSGIAKTLQSISIPNEIWEKHDNEERQYIKSLALIGWPFLLDVPVSFISQFNEEYGKKETTDKFINEFEIAMCDFYTEENLNKILARWASINLLQNRIQILSDVISSHINRKYTLSIPALLPQIEGVLSQYFINSTELGKKKINIYIDYLLEGDDRYLPFKGIIIDELYKKFHWGDESMPALSRHAILHGADTNYNTEINSLKIILIFDMIVYVLKKGSSFQHNSEHYP
jgi:hypothetical protein